MVAGADDELRHSGRRSIAIGVHRGPAFVVVSVGIYRRGDMVVRERRPEGLFGRASGRHVAVEGEAWLVPVGDGAGSRMLRQVVVEPGDLSAGTSAQTVGRERV